MTNFIADEIHAGDGRRGGGREKRETMKSAKWKSSLTADIIT